MPTNDPLNVCINFPTVDTTPPSIKYCPADIFQGVAPGVPSVSVNWNAPSATDLSGNVSLALQSHFSGSNFTSNRTLVTYTFVDGSGNEASCKFYVILSKGKPISYDISNLKMC